MLKSCFEFLQIERGRLFCSLVGRAGFSVSTELKNPCHYCNHGFSQYTRSRWSSARSPGIVAFPSTWALRLLNLQDVGHGALNSLSCSHQTREDTQAPGAAGSQFVLPPGFIFHLNYAYSAVGMYWYLADFWESAEAHVKTPPKSFWSGGLLWGWGKRDQETFHLIFSYSLLCVQILPVMPAGNFPKPLSDQRW